MQGNVNKIRILLIEDSKREAFYENNTLKSCLFLTPKIKCNKSCLKYFFFTVMLITR